MAAEFLFPAFLALAIAGLVGFGEFARAGRNGTDSLTLFMLIFAIQCLFPLVCISLYYLFADDALLTENLFFDRVYAVTGPVELSLIACLAVLFTAFLYLAYTVVVDRLRFLSAPGLQRSIGVRKPIYVSLVCLGLLSGVYLLLSFGSGLSEGYRSLILLRNLDPIVERNFVNANLFSLTQTFLFIGMLGPFVTGHGGRLSRLWPLWILIVVALAIFGVSRRAFFIPMIFCVFVVLLRGGRIGITRLAAALVFAGLIVVFGKTVLANLAGSGGELAIDAGSAATYLLLFVSDVGITVVESLGTITMIDIPFRFGIDHLFSVLRRIPSGAMGFDTPFLPDRIVRYSTEVFLGADALDIPPGLFGQMWLDFGLFGPVFYGVAVGAVLGWIESLRRSFVNDWPAAALFSLVIFVFALPVNSGSLDFTFSVDLIILSALALLFVKVRQGDRAR